MSGFIEANVVALGDPITGALVGFIGPDGNEYFIMASPYNAAGVAAANTQASATAAVAQYQSLFLQTGNGAALTLTNPVIRATNNINNFTQIGLQNKNTGANSSADMICYPDNNSNDTSGFVDIGITSSGFTQATYSVTGPNEPYLFGSSPIPNAAASGDMVIATDSRGTSNGIRFYTNGFAQAIGGWAMKILGSGMVAIAKGMALVGSSKVFVANGAATAYTVPAAASYVYLTTSATAIAFTLPAAAAAIDGLMLTITTGSAVTTPTFASTGATFAAAPTALAANVPVKFIYHHATLQWLPA